MADPTSPPTSELQTKLAHLKASATQQYSLKNYSAAAEFYSEAAEVQDALNGEMSPENADLLYLYGRCLYHVGVSKSDVLGGKVAGNGNGGEEPRKKKKRKTTSVAESSAAGVAKGESSLVADAIKNGEGKTEDEEHSDVLEGKPSSDKPFFQITGDENWTDSEDDDSDEDGEDADAAEGEAEGDEEEDDDFAIAYEILDVARVLLGRKLESLQESETKDKEPSSSSSSSSSTPETRLLLERLADTHDLQAEIKLENEQFADAVADAQAALDYKLQLFPQESGMVAEAHYKLAIALDFAALPAPPAEEEEGKETNAEGQKKAKEEPKVDESMRALAALEMQKAIASCQLRMQKDSEAGKPAAAVADIKSMVGEMKNRLAELRKPVEMGATGLAGAAEEVPDGADPLRGVLGAMLGASSKAEQARVLQQATKQANDIGGLVKKRKAKAVGVEGEIEGKGKKAKVEEEK